eukprot:scaffold208779_cov25-Tisochrysis_lutea.AAC.2
MTATPARWAWIGRVVPRPTPRPTLCLIAPSFRCGGLGSGELDLACPLPRRGGLGSWESCTQRGGLMSGETCLAWPPRRRRGLESGESCLAWLPPRRGGLTSGESCLARLQPSFGGLGPDSVCLSWPPRRSGLGSGESCLTRTPPRRAGLGSGESCRARDRSLPQVSLALWRSTGTHEEVRGCLVVGTESSCAAVRPAASASSASWGASSLSSSNSSASPYLIDPKSTGKRERERKAERRWAALCHRWESAGRAHRHRR